MEKEITIEALDSGGFIVCCIEEGMLKRKICESPNKLLAIVTKSLFPDFDKDSLLEGLREDLENELVKGFGKETS